LGKFQDCIDDCSAAIEIQHLNAKAFFRRASAREQSGDPQGAFKDLTELLHFDPKNAEAISAMRRLKGVLEKEREKDSEVNRILTTIASGKHVVEGLKGLIGLCVDDAAHAVDFIRKGGLLQVGKLIESELAKPQEAADTSLVVLGLRIFGAASTHQAFVKLGVSIDSAQGTSDENFLVIERSPAPEASTLRWSGICRLIGFQNGAISQAASSLALRCLKVWPAGVEIPSTAPPAAPKPAPGLKKPKHYENEDDRPRVELLDDDEEDEAEEVVEESSSKKPEAPPPMKEYDLFLQQPQAVMAIRGWLQALSNPEWESFSMAAEALSAFLSTVEDYIGQEKIVDIRMEGLPSLVWPPSSLSGLVERKERIAKVKLLKMRSKKHAEWAIDEGRSPPTLSLTLPQELLMS
jgi:tetratricopeptide (TPR) repeat protein